MTENKIRLQQGRRLAEARKKAGWRSARAAAIDNEWAESSYRAHENGTRTIGQDDAETYARRFRLAGVTVTAQEILFGPAGSPDVAREASIPISERAREAAALFAQLPPDRQDWYLAGLANEVQRAAPKEPAAAPRRSGAKTAK